MTKRLYYNDSDLLTFEGEIIESGKYENNYYTLLDRSAFYPTSGGQSHDVGFLNKIRVIDVVEDGDIVKHITEKPIGEIGTKVVGEIDKERRDIKRQQHTSQHIISQSMHRLFGFVTMSVHLGDEYGSVELDADSINDPQLYEAESMSNQVIEAEMPVEILYHDKSEIENLPMRKIPAREGNIRIIKIGNFDYAACGGTHCNNSSEIRIIKFVGVEKIRKRTLVKFICGNQAFDDYRSKFNIIDRLSENFTCHHEDLHKNIDRLKEENKNLKKKITELNKAIIPIKAEKLISQAESLGDMKFIIAEDIDIESNQLIHLATFTSEKISGVVILLNADKFIISSNNENVNAGDIAKAIMKNTSMKGGGNSKLAQVGNIDNTQFNRYKSLIRKILSND